MSHDYVTSSTSSCRLQSHLFFFTERLSILKPTRHLPTVVTFIPRTSVSSAVCLIGSRWKSKRTAEYMEVEKRKRLEDKEVDAKRAKGSKREAEVKKTVAENDKDDDAEVEEFFAILRRIHVAVKYFEEGHGGKGRQTTARPWNPNFQREDFEGIKADKGLETEEDNGGLDLNAEPDTQ